LGKTAVTAGKEGNVQVGDLNFGVIGFPVSGDNYAVGTVLPSPLKYEAKKVKVVYRRWWDESWRFHEAMISPR
jgi:hypothetical protein